MVVEIILRKWGGLEGRRKVGRFFILRVGSLGIIIVLFGLFNDGKNDVFLW